ncbi:hypothetical protein SAMN05660479_00340 [Microbulbifer thermotolerans]|nr:hypothetical protein SAMN05660479_00340 [Microbulbifer thermotolerans]
MYPSELQGSTRAFSKCPSYCLSAPEATIVSTRINQRFLNPMRAVADFGALRQWGEHFENIPVSLCIRRFRKVHRSSEFAARSCSLTYTRRCIYQRGSRQVVSAGRGISGRVVPAEVRACDSLHTRKLFHNPGAAFLIAPREYNRPTFVSPSREVNHHVRKHP